MRKIFVPNGKTGKGRWCHKCQEHVQRDTFGEHQLSHRRERGGYGEGGVPIRQHKMGDGEQLSTARDA